MIQFEFFNDTLPEIEKRLGSMSGQARPVLKRALNLTAKRARKMLAQEAQKKYAVKQGAVNKGMKIKNATNRKLDAVINVTGRPNELKGFKVSPSKYRTGNDRPDVVKAKVVKANPMKELIRPRDQVKAFIVKFQSGHVTLAQRKGEARLPIETKFSVSNPQMVGSKRVYQLLRPDIGAMLEAEIERQIDRQLRKGAYKK